MARVSNRTDELLPVLKKVGRPRKNPAPAPAPANAAEMLLETQRGIYRQSFYHFHQALFPQINGDVFEPNWHVKFICDSIQGDLERCALGLPRVAHIDVNVPPRTGKSIILNVSAPLWFHLLKPNGVIVTVANGTRLAQDMLGFTKKVMKSAWFQSHYPDVRLVVDNDSMYELNTGGRRTAYGIESNIMGINSDLTVCDDLLDSDTAESDTERARVHRKWRQSVFGRFQKKDVSLFININQRLHTNDVSGVIQSELAEWFRVIKLPSEARSGADVLPSEWFTQYTPEGDSGNYLLWDSPGRLSREDLRFARALLGTTAYSQQHLQRPKSREGGVLKAAWFAEQLLSAEQWADKVKGRQVEYKIFLDGAETSNPKNDATCWALTAKLDNQLYVLDVQWRRLEFTDLVRSFTTYLEANRVGAYPAKRVFIEGKSIGRQLLSQLKKDRLWFNGREVQPGRESKYARAVSIVSFVEGGRVHCVTGPWVEDFVEECSSFTGKEKGKAHDDALDALIYAVRDAKTSAVMTFGDDV